MRQTTLTRVAAMALGALLLALAAAPSEARPPSRGEAGQAREQAPAERRAAVSREQAAGAVQRATGGRVLAVDTVSRDGRPVHRVKVLLSGGRVRTVTVDALTGELR